MKIEIKRASASGRLWVWRLWRYGRCIARGTAGSKESAERMGKLARDAEMRRYMRDCCHHVKAPAAPAQVPDWLKPAGEGDGFDVIGPDIIAAHRAFNPCRDLLKPAGEGDD